MLGWHQPVSEQPGPVYNELTKHKPAIQSKTSTRSVAHFKKNHVTLKFLTWADNTCMNTWYWSMETLFWQVSIDQNIDVQYQRRIL